MPTPGASSTAPVPIHYRIRPEDPAAHLFKVELRVETVARTALTLDLPAWIPGSYLIRDFAKHIVRLEARGDRDQALAARKLDKQTWEIPSEGDRLTIGYWVYAWELSARAAHLDATHAYFNGPSLFLRVKGQENTPCRVEILPPTEMPASDWRIATTLPREGAEPFGFGTYRAECYEQLIDHPVQIGRFDLIEFPVRGVPHRIAISGRHRGDGERLARDLARICTAQANLFGALPLDQYLFLLTVLGEGYGGLEHRDSTSLIARRDDLPQPGKPEVTEGYRRLLGLCSHEYFHLWNVKRIRPAVFVGTDLTHEAHTRLLWVFEGITSYYDDLFLVRSGCIDERSYLELLAQGITRVLRTPGRNLQCLADASFDAWIKFYKPDENAPNAIVSYYAKGALVALALDLTLRQRTGQRCSLDEVMRALWVTYGQTGRGVPEDGVETLVEAVSGLDLDEFFSQAIRGTADLDLPPLLADVGIGLRLRSATSATDQGGVVDRFAPLNPRKTLGVRLDEAQAEAVIANAFSGGAAMRAGLSAGDHILAIDHIRATRANLDTLVDAIPAGASVPVHVFRRDELMVIAVTPAPAPLDTCDLCLLPDAPPAAQDHRRAWLGPPAGD
jgi:predicted metalloprotease with PDZ domain